MRSKRLLTLLLVFCMVLSCVTPAAAVTAGSEAYNGEAAQNAPQNDLQEEQAEAQSFDMIVSEDGTVTRVPTLRDDTANVSAANASSVQGGAD